MKRAIARVDCSTGGFQDELFDFFENFLKGAQRVHTFCRHSSLDIAFFCTRLTLIQTEEYI